MEDLSLHILDIAENSINAGATKIVIRIAEDPGSDNYSLSVEDNGHGMDGGVLLKAEDPFFTYDGDKNKSKSKKQKKRFGLGIPLLKQAATECGGEFRLDSEPGKGTTLFASFRFGHIDRKPLGNIGATMLSMMCGHPEIRYVLFYDINGGPASGSSFHYGFDSDALKEALGETPVNLPEILLMVRDAINTAVMEGRDQTKTAIKSHNRV